jgi:hypothetical protein
MWSMGHCWGHRRREKRWVDDEESSTQQESKRRPWERWLRRPSAMRSLHICKRTSVWSVSELWGSRGEQFKLLRGCWTAVTEIVSSTGPVVAVPCLLLIPVWVLYVSSGGEHGVDGHNAAGKSLTADVKFAPSSADSQWLCNDVIDDCDWWLHVLKSTMYWNSAQSMLTFDFHPLPPSLSLTASDANSEPS